MKRIYNTLLAITLICTSVHAQEITVTTGKCIIRNNRDIPVWVWWDEEGISHGPVAEYIKDYFCRWRPGGDWMNYFQILAEGNMASGSSSGDLLMYKILQPGETFEILTGNASRSTVERSVRKCLAVISQEEMEMAPVYKSFCNIEMFDFCFDSISIDMKDTDIPPTWQTPYATLFSTDGKPVNVYSDSSRTEIIGTYNVNKAGIRINVPLRQMTSEMIGDKIWISTSEGYIPKFEGWVEKRHCFRIIRQGADNAVRIYDKPDKDAPVMELMCNRGLMANILHAERSWMKVMVLYHRPIEGWVKISDLEP